MSQVKTTQKADNLRKYYVIIALAILGICVFYALVFSVQSRRFALTLSQEYVVLTNDSCPPLEENCINSPENLQVGDRLLAVKDHDFNTEEDSAILQVFLENEVEGIVPVTVLRGEDVITVTHRLNDSTYIDAVSATAVALIISLPFWVVATVVLLIMHPHDDKWLLFIVFSYLAAIWLSIGINSSSDSAYSHQLTRAVAWLMVPVIIHLHLTAPISLLRKSLPAWLALLYIMSITFALAEIRRAVPDNLFIYVFALAILIGAFILIFRSFLRPPSADRLASRFMLTGLMIAPGMAVLLWVVPQVMGSVPGQSAINLLLLAMPAMPLFYGYALYKHQLGRQESRFNRLLALYSAFLIYLSLLIIVFNYTRPQIAVSNELLLFASVMVALMLAVLPVRDIIFSIIGRLAYGERYNRQDIVNNYSKLINEASGHKEVSSLLLENLLPVLQVEESVMVLFKGRQSSYLYQHGLNLEQMSLDENRIRELHQFSEVYMISSKDNDITNSRELEWLHLIISLEVRGNPIGFWLFGERRPDNYYNSEDIQMLKTLASHLALKLYNDDLYATVQQELAERKIAEGNLARLSERLQLINDIDQAILSARSARKIAQVTLRKLSNLIPYDRATIVLFDFAKKELELLAIHDKRRLPPDDTPQQKIPLVQELNYLPGGDTWIVPDIAQLEGESDFADHLAAEGLSSILSTPLLVSGKLIGALNLSAIHPGTMNKRYQQTAEEVASSLAIAIHNARLRDTVEQHRLELRQLSNRLIGAQENERKHLSYELHDEMGQLLTAITFNLASIENELDANLSSTVGMKINDTRAIVDQLTHQVRDLSLELRPAMLQDLGLEPTLRWYVNTLSNRSELKINLQTINLGGRYSESVETGLYRIIQEALTNVSKHANAGSVQLCLERNESQLHLEITDDGQGFDIDKVLNSNNVDKGVGLVAIRERINSLDGDLKINSLPGHGTELRINIPLENYQ